MDTQNLINEINALEGYDVVRMDAASAFDNANATVGAQASMTNVSEEYAEMFLGTIRGMLCDADCYGVSDEFIQWFKAREIKG